MALPGFKSIPLSNAQLSLSAVLKCGQSFLWTVLTPPAQLPATESPPLDAEYRFCLRDRVVCLRQSSDTLFYRSVFPESLPVDDTLRDAETLEWLTDYFQLDIDLVHLYSQWAQRDSVFAQFQHRFVGIRMLRQDPWENLVSFICSSNNNISRITKMVQSLCTHYSPPLLTLEHPYSPSEKIIYHPFPPPSVLADPSVASRLRALGFGYRADFVQRTAQMLVDTHGSYKQSEESGQSVEPSELWLKQLRQSSTHDARQELLKFVGVGRKVADCILLMSLDKKEVVPVDTHVHQIAIKYYGVKGSTTQKANMTPKLYEDLNHKFFSIWGEFAGWAHSVLFTADLKAFSSYGLPSPSVTPTPKKRAKQSAEVNNALPTPPMTPTPRQLKRKSEHAMQMEQETSRITKSQSSHVSAESVSLVDRVKKRTRRAL